MKTVSCWQDLEPYGFVALTGEACGLMYRNSLRPHGRRAERRTEMLRRARPAAAPSAVGTCDLEPGRCK